MSLFYVNDILKPSIGSQAEQTEINILGTIASKTEQSYNMMSWVSLKERPIPAEDGYNPIQCREWVYPIPC